MRSRLSSDQVRQLLLQKVEVIGRSVHVGDCGSHKVVGNVAHGLQKEFLLNLKLGWDGIDCWYWCRHRSKAQKLAGRKLSHYLSGPSG